MLSGVIGNVSGVGRSTVDAGIMAPPSGARSVDMFEGLLQPMHLLLIAAIAMLVFGPQKLPQIGRSLGEGIRGFKEAIKSAETGANTSDSNGSPDAGTQSEKK